MNIFSIIGDFIDLPGQLDFELSNNVRKKKNAKIKSLEDQNKQLVEENTILWKRIGNPEEKKRLQFMAKFGIMKNLCWKDGQLDDKESLFMQDYIINSTYIANDDKVILIQNLKEAPPEKSFLKKVFSSKERYDKSMLFDSSEEASLFKNNLKELAECDSGVSNEEEKYLNDIFRMLDV